MRLEKALQRASDTPSTPRVVVPLALQLTNLVKEGETTVSSLEQVKGPFEKAVKNSDACQALIPSRDEQSWRSPGCMR